MKWQRSPKKLALKAAILGVAVTGLVLILAGRGEAESVRGVTTTIPTTSSTSSPSVFENWRMAPIGDGEDTADSYHSYDHRPQGTDPRDVLLQQHTVHRCPNNGFGMMVSGLDPRYYEMNKDKRYKERNPKFICNPAGIVNSPHKPCVVYSFGSFDDISFELGIMNVTKHACQVHTFDPETRPSHEVAARHNFTVYDMALSGFEHDQKYKRLDTIMKELGHSHIQILKIDIEGGEKGAIPALQLQGTLEHVDQIAIEFHSTDLMREGLDILESNGFGIVYARREDRCGHCTEVTLVKF